MGFFVVASMGSNRTFMELKFIFCLDEVHAPFCSNRTFMELKLNGIARCQTTQH